MLGWCAHLNFTPDHRWYLVLRFQILDTSGSAAFYTEHKSSCRRTSFLLNENIYRRLSNNKQYESQIPWIIYLICSPVQTFHYWKTRTRCKLNFSNLVKFLLRTFEITISIWVCKVVDLTLIYLSVRRKLWCASVLYKFCEQRDSNTM